MALLAGVAEPASREPHGAWTSDSTTSSSGWMSYCDVDGDDGGGGGGDASGVHVRVHVHASPYRSSSASIIHSGPRGPHFSLKNLYSV